MGHGASVQQRGQAVLGRRHAGARESLSVRTVRRHSAREPQARHACRVVGRTSARDRTRAAAHGGRRRARVRGARVLGVLAVLIAVGGVEGIAKLHKLGFGVAVDGMTMDLLPYVRLNKLNTEIIKIHLFREHVALLQDDDCVKALRELDINKIVLDYIKGVLDARPHTRQEKQAEPIFNKQSARSYPCI